MPDQCGRAFLGYFCCNKNYKCNICATSLLSYSFLNLKIFGGWKYK
jgi:hypothetical protein